MTEILYTEFKMEPSTSLEVRLSTPNIHGKIVSCIVLPDALRIFSLQSGPNLVRITSNQDSLRQGLPAYLFSRFFLDLPALLGCIPILFLRNDTLHALEGSASLVVHPKPEFAPPPEYDFVFSLRPKGR